MKKAIGPVAARAAIRPPALAAACLFLSGFAATAAEVSWIRKASLVFGSTTYAVSTVLAVFFVGLACGSYLFGRVGERSSRPLRLYARLEIALGLVVLASPVVFDLAEHLYGTLYRAQGGRTGGPRRRNL